MTNKHTNKMATPIPAGKTFIDTINRSFVDVPVQKENDNAIPTTEFLEASESLTTLFDVLGSAAFKPVKSDMIGNITKLRERQAAAPTESQTLQELVINEIKSKKHTATEGLVWLVRGLDFTAQALSKNLSTPSDELSVSFRSAYADTLKPHHSFVVKPLFSAAMSACPYRKDFYEKLGSDQQQVETSLREWLTALESDIAILKTFLDRKEAQWK
ncbi:glycolipid transfer het-c2 protein [Rutstroemia sp. NJR-2017a BVV2]|nr:glycolipid transfer het-c2 protein [Rutstroemia sp. NJR-2017a BVV2]